MQLLKPLLAVFSYKIRVRWSYPQDTEPGGNAASSLHGCGWPSPPLQRCALVPLQAHSCTLVPLAEFAPLTSRQLPSRLCTVYVPSPLNVRYQSCSGRRLQLIWSTWVPLAVPALRYSRHFEPAVVM